MMGRNFGVEYDESELMDELQELDNELIDEDLSLPSYIPAGQQPVKPAAATNAVK